MKLIEEMTNEQLEKHALDILAKELGPLGMARYLRMHGAGNSNYTRDRHKWLDHLTIDQVIEEARKLEAANSDPR